MTPAARTQTTIELLDAILVAAKEGGAAADTLIARGFAARRYAGSKDRRAIRELIYRAIRSFGEPPPSGRAALVALADADPALAGTFDGSSYGPPAISSGELRAAFGAAPAWLVQRLEKSGLDAEERAALLGRAPLDLRVNRLNEAAQALVIEGASAVDGLDDALRLAPDSGLEAHPDVASGKIEIQDAGSQWMAKACGAAPGMTVIDLCAGAGGKTLALAADMQDRGRIIACDTDRARLSRLAPRAARAGVTIAETRLLDPLREIEAFGDLRGAADIVLVDAPCSGTGTWRRNPEARWRLTPARLDRLVATQMRLLDLGATLVRPGGMLVHVVCSLLDAEGQDQAAAFLDRHPDWSAPCPAIIGSRRGAGLRLTPHSHSTDGFFVATMRAPC